MLGGSHVEARGSTAGENIRGARGHLTVASAMGLSISFAVGLFPIDFDRSATGLGRPCVGSTTRGVDTGISDP